jgi:hypothetical protein
VIKSEDCHARVGEVALNRNFESLGICYVLVWEISLFAFLRSLHSAVLRLETLTHARTVLMSMASKQVKNIMVPTLINMILFHQNDPTFPSFIMLGNCVHCRI